MESHNQIIVEVKRMNVFVLGAGASRGYQGSKTNQKMPLANDFFRTYNSLKISESEYVLVGDIINYLIENKKMKLEEFADYNANIEDIHSEINEKLIESLQKSPKHGLTDIQLWKANAQLVFLFNSVINEVQNGETSKIHSNFIKSINNEDSIITFNWDTLLDRALKEEYTDWTTDGGYFVRPKAVYRDQWVFSENKIITTKKCPLLLKLHGSTNWLTSHITQENGKITLSQTERNDAFYVYESCVNPYATFKGRFMPGYEDFSYGYYPPNIPEKMKIPEGYSLFKLNIDSDPRIINNLDSDDSGLVSMPLIIPPIKHKDYDLFDGIFNMLWDKATEEIVKAQKIFIIGYSFPVTDTKSINMFKKAFTKRQDMPKVIIINPNPNEVKDRFIYEFGINESHMRVYADYFDEKFNILKVQHED